MNRLRIRLFNCVLASCMAFCFFSRSVLSLPDDDAIFIIWSYDDRNFCLHNLAVNEANSTFAHAIDYFIKLLAKYYSYHSNSRNQNDYKYNYVVGNGTMV
jgi:hypothetical protein